MHAFEPNDVSKGGLDGGDGGRERLVHAILSLCLRLVAASAVAWLSGAGGAERSGSAEPD